MCAGCHQPAPCCGRCVGKVSARPTVRLFLHQSSRLRARHPAAFPLGDSGFVSTLGTDGVRLAWTGCPSALRARGCGCARRCLFPPSSVSCRQLCVCCRARQTLAAPSPVVSAVIAGLPVPFPFSHCWEFGSGRSMAGTQGWEQLRGAARRQGRPWLLSDVALLWDKD